MSDALYDLTLVVPCYNEADNIPLFYKTATECFEQAGVGIEIVFVNDGSQDGTAQLLRRVVESARGKHAVQAIDFSRNFGKESALYAGMQAARGNNICLIDADMQQTPHDALRMYRLLMENADVDCVAACQVDRKEGFVLKLFKRAFYRTFNGMADDISIPANVSDFRVFRRPVRDALLALPERERFSKGLFAWIGFNTLEIPYEAEQRAAGTSKWSFRKLFRYAATGIFGFTTWPLKIAVWLGSICAVAALPAVSAGRVPAVRNERPGLPHAGMPDPAVRRPAACCARSDRRIPGPRLHREQAPPHLPGKRAPGQHEGIAKRPKRGACFARVDSSRAARSHMPKKQRALPELCP